MSERESTIEAPASPSTFFSPQARAEIRALVKLWPEARAEIRAAALEDRIDSLCFWEPEERTGCLLGITLQALDNKELSFYDLRDMLHAQMNSDRQSYGLRFEDELSEDAECLRELVELMDEGSGESGEVPSC